MLTKPILIFDNKDTNAVVTPEQFRISADFAVSASAQFSEQALRNLCYMIPTRITDLCIIDLRQESHGFINGIPITWYVDQNRANVFKTLAQIVSVEQELLDKISAKPEVIIHNAIKLDEGKIIPINPQSITSSNVSSEQQLVRAIGANYMRFPVLDHHKPDDQQVNRYLNFVKHDVKPGSWMHFHCRGGKGRTSTFMAMHEIIYSAKHSEFEQIMKRQENMGNKKLAEVPMTADKLWKVGPAKERHTFLKQFHAFVAVSHNYPQRSWSFLAHKAISKSYHTIARLVR